MRVDYLFAVAEIFAHKIDRERAPRLASVRIKMHIEIERKAMKGQPWN